VAAVQKTGEFYVGVLVGLGRIAVSEMEAPKLSANLV
jgi:hypothetical protein